MITAEIFIKPRRHISDVGQVPETDMMPLVGEQLSTLREQLGISGMSDVDEKVYNSRKTIKKLRALLLLIKNHIPRDTYEEISRVLSYISKKLAPVREYAVLKQTCALYKQKILDTAGAVLYTHLEHQLADQYCQLFHKFVENDMPGILRSNLNNLRIITEIPAIFLDNKYIEGEIGKTYKRCRKHFNTLTLASTSKQFHQFRIYSKSLRYQLGTLNKAGLGSIPSKDKLDKINHLLGIKNDLNVFIKYLKVNARDIHRQTSPFFKKEIKIMRRKILKEAGNYYGHR